MVGQYIPDTGHIVWLTLDPQLGHEQAGRRPFLVLSPSIYNDKTSLVVGVSVTSREKGYPFEIPLNSGGRVTGVALVDQIKSLDWRARSGAFAEEASVDTLQAVRKLLSIFLEL